MAVPYTFANVLGGSSIPLSQLDDNFDYLTASPSFSGNVTITGTLGVGGAVIFSSTLNVAGITTLSNNLSVAGSSTFTGGATFSSSVTFDSKTITGTTGTGNFVLSVSPTVTSATLVAPDLGTPTSGDLVNCTNLPLSSVTGLGSGVGNFLAIPSSSNLAAAVTGETGTGALVFGTNPVLITPNIGTPSAGVLTNCTGLPLTTGIIGTLPVANGGTGITSFGSGIATWLGTPSSANLRAALTDETGSGAAVFADSPTLVTPVLGTPTSGTLTNCTGLPLSTGVTGTVSQSQIGTNVVGTGPAFGVYSNASQSGLASAAATKIALDTEEFDTNNNFDPVTNYRFTPTVAGYYQINCSAYLTATDLTYNKLMVYKNGSIIKTVLASSGIVSTGNILSGSCMIYFNGTTDYIEFYVEATTSAGTYTIVSGPDNTYASGCLIRSD